jgi:hypothetical protein
MGLAFRVRVHDNQVRAAHEGQWWMAEISSGHVVSELPDLTGVALADLPRVSLRHETVVLERVTEHPKKDHSDQNF